MKKIFIVFVFMLFVSGCNQALMLGDRYPSRPIENMHVTMDDKPKCEKRTEIARIVTKDLWIMNQALKNAKEEAAEIGADGIIIKKYSPSPAAGIHASAYKCLE